MYLLIQAYTDESTAVKDYERVSDAVSHRARLSALIVDNSGGIRHHQLLYLKYMVDTFNFKRAASKVVRGGNETAGKYPGAVYLLVRMKI